ETDSGNYAGYFVGNIFVTGQVFAGVKGALVPFPDGSKRLLYCMESPEHWFEDFGTAKLTRGRAVVKLDADFAKAIKRGTITCSRHRKVIVTGSMCAAKAAQASRYANCKAAGRALRSPIASSASARTSRRTNASPRSISRRRLPHGVQDARNR